jgi:hypothetical protein
LRIAFDITLMRPGCALLQAAYQCGPHLADLFPVDIWLLSPTADLKVYNIERTQLSLLQEKTRLFHELGKEAVGATSQV